MPGIRQKIIFIMLNVFCKWRRRTKRFGNGIIDYRFDQNILDNMMLKIEYSLKKNYYYYMFLDNNMDQLFFSSLK